MVVQPNGTGWIEVICGPMFSGKTEELLRRLRRVRIARQKVQVFKPEIDQRYSVREVVSHDDERTDAIPVRTARELKARVLPDTEVVGIDEAQFFDEALIAVADELATEGRRVVVAGLDTDYRSEPFEPIPQLMARAEYVTKLLAICVRCGNPANRTLRNVGGEARVEVGAAERYEAVCRACYAEARLAPGAFRINTSDEKPILA
ncbi:MAG: thymidine kinase [Deltaproteobacteria bacterium]|jgi:thymidine kinase